MKTKEELIQILIEIKQQLNESRHELTPYNAGVLCGRYSVYNDLLTSNYFITAAEYKQINLHV